MCLSNPPFALFTSHPITFQPLPRQFLPVTCLLIFFIIFLCRSKALQDLMKQTRCNVDFLSSPDCKNSWDRKQCLKVSLQSQFLNTNPEFHMNLLFYISSSRIIYLIRIKIIVKLHTCVMSLS